MKTNTHHRTIVAVLLAALAVGLAVSGAWGTQYVLIDLGTLGGYESRAYGINNLGQVVGYATNTNNDFRGFMWDGTMHDTGAITGYSQKIAYAINDAGQVAGLAYNYGDLQNQAFVWLNPVNSLMGAISGHGVNASGVVAGYQSISGTVTGMVDHACTSSGGTVTDLGTLGGLNSYAYDLNANGVVVGESMLSDDMTSHACLWRNLIATDLGSLGGTRSAAYAINNSGQIAGYSDTAAGVAHACLTTMNASWQVANRTDLGALDAGYSYAYDVNNLGQVVGTSGRGFLWQNGQMIDINTLLPPDVGWMVASANSINDYGQVAGWGLSWDGKPHAIMMTPVEANIASAKGAGDGTRVGLPSSTVTACFNGFFYVEQDDRAGGMRVSKANHGLAVGQKVIVSGSASTTGDGEKYILASLVAAVGTGSIAPVAVTNRQIGGMSDPKRISTVRFGLNNTGMLVTTTGTVTSVGPSYFYIDDGSKVSDGVGQGIRVSASGLTLPSVGQHVIVTGVVSCVKTSAINRLILTRTQSDIRVFP